MTIQTSSAAVWAASSSLGCRERNLRPHRWRRAAPPWQGRPSLLLGAAVWLPYIRFSSPPSASRPGHLFLSALAARAHSQGSRKYFWIWASVGVLGLWALAIWTVALFLILITKTTTSALRPFVDGESEQPGGGAALGRALPQYHARSYNNAE